jgi:hypothetical protein
VVKGDWDLTAPWQVVVLEQVWIQVVLEYFAVV